MTIDPEVAENSPLDHVGDAGLVSLVDEIREKHGDALLAILVYGSWLRGKRDTMLDFYVLVDHCRSLDSRWQGWMCRLLPPNVYHIHQQSEETDVRAKYALLTLKQFHHAMVHDFHSYFWARFAQPCKVLFARDAGVRARLAEAFSLAAGTFVRRVLPAMPAQFSSEDLWTRGLGLTYGCELRTESNKRGDMIFASNPDYYRRLTHALSHSGTRLVPAPDPDVFCNRSRAISKKLSAVDWWLRRWQGKLLSMLRLLKAAFTFNEPLD